MSARTFSRFAVILTSAFALRLLSLAPVSAQTEAPQPEIENAKFQFEGVVNSNAVYVRSGPSENDYPTMKLDKGAEVVVLGAKFDWLKVVPPQGSFCYVAKAYVDRHGNGSVGRVTSTLNVRVGSQLNELKAKIGTKLEPGAAVEIVGEEQEYFKIRPPEGVYYYVNKQFVDPVRAINLAQNGDDANAPTNPTAQPDIVGPMVDLDQPPIVTENPSDDADMAPLPTGGEGGFAENEPPAARDPLAAPVPPADSGMARATDATPATQPTADAADAEAADAEAEFDRLEGEYAEASLKPLDEQPVTELLKGYEKLASGQTDLPESLRRIAEFKVEVLKSRLEVQQQFAETRQGLDQMKQKQMALTAEQEELQQRIQENEIKFYTAVGTLRPSSLQQGTETLYRLTDPSNGRTVVYLRTNDSNIAQRIGEFIGVSGEVKTESPLNIRVITMSNYEPVNPAQVGQAVAAQIVPPSLLPGTTVRSE